MFYYLWNRVDPKVIFFQSFAGAQYTDSPKAIYEALRRDPKYDDYTCVWGLKKRAETPPEAKGTLVVKYASPDYYRYYARAAYIITNFSDTGLTIKKRKQTYVQTWHGTPLKCIGYDIEVDYESPYNTVKGVRMRYKKETRILNYLLSQSRYGTQRMLTAFPLTKFGKENNIIEQGYPRNDFLFRYTEADVKRIRKSLRIPKGKRAILYAPTFRDTAHEAGVGYVYLPETDFDMLAEQLPQDCVILYRAHYLIAKTFDFKKYRGRIIDASKVNDINNLYVISDMLVTDYSSCLFDYANLKRPMLFYMYDLDYYKDKARGLYLDMDELPGPIVRTEQELLQAIERIGEVEQEYRERYEAFCNRVQCRDDGHAAERVIKAIGL